MSKPSRRPSSTNTTGAQASAASATPPCIRINARGAVLDISVSPNAKCTEVVGLHDGALRIRLAAQPVEGQANASLLRWLADELGIPRNQLELLRGDTSRRKQVQINLAANQILHWLQAKLQP